jgi:hypothetical protein
MRAMVFASPSRRCPDAPAGTRDCAGPSAAARGGDGLGEQMRSVSASGIARVAYEATRLSSGLLGVEQSPEWEFAWLPQRPRSWQEPAAHA